MLWYSKHITLKKLLLGSVFVGNISFAQPSVVIKSPTDDFSQNLLAICNDAPAMFSKTKGRLNKKNGVLNYGCRKKLPGALASYITGDEDATCVFYFGSYETMNAAEDAMQKLNTKISLAMLKQMLSKEVDTTDDPALLKRIAIAEIIDDGYYDYNICIDIVRQQNSLQPYNLMLKIKSCPGFFYRFVYRNQPLRSPEFSRTFSKINAQFNSTDSYYCSDLLPGFSCSMIDSAGKQQLQMEKRLNDFPDARVEFECLTSNIRAMLGQGFLYYLPPTDDNTLRKAVFIRVQDHDDKERKSISTTLVKGDDGVYSVRVVMYHP